MTQHDLAGEVVRVLDPGDFTQPVHSFVYLELENHWNAGEPVGLDFIHTNWVRYAVGGDEGVEELPPPPRADYAKSLTYLAEHADVKQVALAMRTVRDSANEQARSRSIPYVPDLSDRAEVEKSQRMWLDIIDYAHEQGISIRSASKYWE